MMMIAQCRGARALLAWSAQNLADAAALGVATVRRYETGAVVALASVEAMESALSAAGIIFIAEGEQSTTGGTGVRLALGKAG